MKIGFIADNFYPNVQRGAEIEDKILIEEGIRRGHEIVKIGPMVKNVDLYIVANFIDTFNHGELMAYLSRRPYVNIEHDLRGPQYAFYPTFARDAVINIYHSPYQKAFIEKFAGEFNSFLHPMCMPATFKPMTIGRYHKNQILFVGDYSWEKGYKELVEWLAENERCKIWHYGGGFDKHHPKMKEMGYVGQEVMPFIYNRFQSLIFLPHYPQACFCSDTNIITKNSIEKIQNLKKGDSVLTIDGSFQVIKKTMKRTFNGNLIILQPHYSPSIRVTPEHPILIRDEKNGQKWVKANEIKKDDWLVLPKPKLEILKNPFKYELSEDFLEFIGYYIGDGWVGKRGWIYIILNKKDKKKLLRLTEIVLKVFDEPRLTIRKTRSRNTIIFAVKDPVLSKQLVEYCGKKCYFKQIPDQIMGINEQQFEGLWRGLLGSDGHIYEKITSFKSTSKKLIGQIYVLMLKYRNIPYIFLNKPHMRQSPTTKKWYLTHECWQLTVRFPRRRKQKFSEFIGDKAYVKVFKIGKEKYNGNVFNFEIEKNQTYVILGATVHNCSRVIAEAYLCKMSNIITNGKDGFTSYGWTVKDYKKVREILVNGHIHFWDKLEEGGIVNAKS